MIGLVVGAVLCCVVGFALYVRFSALDVARWHVDPEEITVPRFSGYFLVRHADGVSPPEFAVEPGELADTVERVVLDTPRTTVLAGDLRRGGASFVTRSGFWGFPDVASVKLVDIGQGRWAVVVFSRLRFGKADFGVNKARVSGWLRALEVAFYEDRHP